jgi:hypothetical protein
VTAQGQRAAEIADPGLAEIVAIWPSLSPASRKALLALVVSMRGGDA